jgi:F-type H+-transporting ATPase subunit delta
VSVAATYAEALFEAAVERDAVPRVAQDLDAFRTAVDETPDLAAVLDNPEIDTRKKKAAVAVLTRDAEPLVANFLQVLLDRGRMEELPAIVDAFSERVARAEGRMTVVAVTAVALPDDLRDRVVARLDEVLGSHVELVTSVDPDLVGGLVLQSGGVVVDASIRQRLDDLRRSLSAGSVDASAAPS